MKKTIAIPARFLDRKSREIRTDLTEAETLELQKYGDQDMTPDEIAAWQVESEAAESATLRYAALAKRDAAAKNYPYRGIIIKLDAGQRADITALYGEFIGGRLPTDYVLPWSESGYEGTESETILIHYAELENFCQGARKQRESAFGAYAQTMAQFNNFNDVGELEAFFDTAFAALF